MRAQIWSEEREAEQVILCVRRLFRTGAHMCSMHTKKEQVNLKSHWGVAKAFPHAQTGAHVLEKEKSRDC